MALRCLRRQIAAKEIRDPPLFFLVHGVAAAFERAGATFGDYHLRAALSTNVNLAELISHLSAILRKSGCQREACRLHSSTLSQTPLKIGFRFSRNAFTPSALSAVVCSKA
jgi:hypothetical protein